MMFIKTTWPSYWLIVLPFLVVTANGQLFVCRWSDEGIKDWVTCFETVIPAKVYKEVLILRKKFYQERPALEVVRTVCANSPHLLQNYAQLCSKLIKKLTPEEKTYMEAQILTCGNATLLNYPLKDSSGKPIDAFKLTLEDASKPL